MSCVEVLKVVFICVAANHLGLVSAVERRIGVSIPIVNCPRCLSFWSVLAYSIISKEAVVASLATAFLSAWSAIWLDLLMGIVDNIYINVYEKIYPTADTTDASTHSSDDSVSDL